MITIVHPEHNSGELEMKTNASYPVYRGIPRQYAPGLGSIFKTATSSNDYSYLKPVAKAGLRSAKKVYQHFMIWCQAKMLNKYYSVAVEQL